MKVPNLLVLCAFIFSGCVPVLLGAGAVTGYMLSNDYALGNVKTDYRTLWDTSLDTVSTAEFNIVEANESKGIIKIKDSDVDVTIKIDSLAVDEQRLKVSSRKYLIPKPAYSQKIFFRIIRGLDMELE
ncbi:MAG: DUF3568 family protein [Candidatus Omnitrophica bacterium]|nr:DUF3568 family protein [Candidatus Omnitrophota bacterium]